MASRNPKRAAEARLALGLSLGFAVAMFGFVMAAKAFMAVG
jgi:hypothetical protein